MVIGTLRRVLLLSLTALALVAAACTPVAPTAPSKPAENAPAAKNGSTSAPAAKAASTSAPAIKAAPTTASRPAAKAAPTTRPAEKAPVSFAGQTIRIIVGTNPGGGFDTWGRLIARHLGKHLPGNPNVIVENMPGASGAIALNHLYNAAPKDGTVIGTFSTSIIMRQLTGDPAIQADMAKMSWIGLAEGTTPTCMVRSDLGIETFQELVDSKKEVIIGATGVGGSTWNFPTALNLVAGSNFKVVPGYDGTAPIRVAMERGEVDGFCNEWEAVVSTSPQYLEGDPPYVYTLVQQGPEKHPDIPDVPLAEEFATTETGKKLLRVINAPLAFFRPLVGPPGVPERELAAVRKGFADIFDDPAFKEEAEKQRLHPHYQTPEWVLQQVEEVLSAPPEVEKLVEQVLNP